MGVQFIDLVMDNGELTRMEVPEQHYDELWEHIEHSMKRGDWLSPARYRGCKANYMGLDLDRVNMGKVVGTL